MPFNYKQCYDISVNISSDLPIYPGDSEIKIMPLYSIEKGDSANILQLNFGSHTGTHVDAPAHFIGNGETLDDINIERFCGPAKVFELQVQKEIKKEDIIKLDINKDDIILFKTKNSELWSHKEFQKDFIYLTPEAAEYLVKRNVKAVGIDYLSIEKFRSKTHSTHQMLLKNKILILEGINLKKVPPGDFFLCFFPLKLQKADGSPVRAVLFK
jgi:arylformamidase